MDNSTAALPEYRIAKMKSGKFRVVAIGDDVGEGLCDLDTREQAQAYIDLVSEPKKDKRPHAWLCQCGTLNKGRYGDAIACWGCRFECKPSMVEKHYRLVEVDE